MAQKVILIIDDDKDVNLILAKELGRLGHRVINTYDGIEGLACVHRENPDMIILDIMMPQKDGYEVLKELKSDQKTKNIPVILLTGLGLDEELSKGISLGAEHYLIKPLKIKLLLQCIETSLASK